MLNPISSPAIPSYPAAQKPAEPSLFSLPLEIREEIDSLLDSSSQQALFKALTTATRHGEPIDSPVLKFHLLLQKVPSEYQQTLVRSDASLQVFAWNQLQLLWESGQLDRVIEKPVLFKLVLLACDQTILKFLREKIQQEPDLKHKLLNWVERSKTEEVQPVAANALTLLIKTGVVLSRQDFRGIRVPGADLSHGIFDHTQFEAADLSASNLQGAWLRQANLHHAKLDKVRFGELPTLEFEDVVNTCCYSPNGQWLAVGCWDSIKLYNAKTLQLRDTYSAPGNNEISFSTNNKWLAVASRGNFFETPTVKLWSIESGPEQAPQVFEGYSSASFSANSKWLALGRFGKVQLWDMESGSEKTSKIFDGYHGALFSPNNKWLVLHNFNISELRSVENGFEQVLDTFEAQNNYLVGYFSFSADGKWLAVDAASSVRIYDAQTLAFKNVFEGFKRQITLSPDGKWLASLNTNGHGDFTTVKLWNLEHDPAQVPKIFKSPKIIDKIEFSPDSKWLVSMYQQQGFRPEVRLWNMEGSSTQAPKVFVSHANSMMMRAISFSHDSKRFALMTNSKTVKIWQVESELELFEGYRGRDSLSLNADGKWLASIGWDDNTVKLWSLKNSSAQVFKIFKGHTGQLSVVLLSADGKWLAVGDTHGAVNLWNVADDSEQTPKALMGHPAGIRSISFSADGQWLASLADDVVQLWSTESNAAQEPKTFRFDDNEDMQLSCISFSADGKCLAAMNSFQGVHLWEIAGAPEQAPKKLSTYPYVVGSISFSADGKWLLASGGDLTVKLWGVEDKANQTPKIFEGHPHGASCFSLSADGRWLASGGRDHTVKLWSISSEQCIATIKGFHEAICSVAWRQTEEGETQLITEGEDKSIQLWQIEEKEGECEAILKWKSYYPKTPLTATGARLEGAVGLSEMNTRLLRQRGAE